MSVQNTIINLMKDPVRPWQVYYFENLRTRDDDDDAYSKTVHPRGTACDADGSAET